MPFFFKFDPMIKHVLSTEVDGEQALWLMSQKITSHTQTLDEEWHVGKSTGFGI